MVPGAGGGISVRSVLAGNTANLRNTTISASPASLPPACYCQYSPPIPPLALRWAEFIWSKGSVWEGLAMEGGSRLAARSMRPALWFRVYPRLRSGSPSCLLDPPPDRGRERDGARERGRARWARWTKGCTRRLEMGIGSE